MRRDRSGSGGFTLVEMLAVVLIIAIVVTLTVSISSHAIAQGNAQQTKMNIAVIMKAVEAYRMDTGDYPTAASSQTLYSVLAGNAKSREFVAALPPQCTRSVGSNRMFLDSWDTGVRYVRNGAAGGGPLVESAGPDMNFSETADNIRSDE